MGKTGKKGKRKNIVKAPADSILNEVDKTFYELQITDLNTKLARLRTVSTELEEKNLQLEEQYSKLDDDRDDVISYLKRSLQEKQSESSELQERITAIQEAKDSKEGEHNEKIIEIETEYKVMREQLTSEVKHLTSKLNGLEEFRIQRDELMQRFEEQEKNIEQQEKRQKQVLYDTEKKFILGKDAIKKEMEKQLFELGGNFEKANELRIAATTQRAVRENIVINNDLNKLIATNERLEKANEEYYTKHKYLQRLCDLYTTERNKAVSDLLIGKGVIAQLTEEHKKLTTTLNNNIAIIELGKKYERELRDTIKREQALVQKVCLLEQNLHSTRCQEIALKTEISNANANVNKYRQMINDASSVIKSAMSIRDSEGIGEADKIYLRETLLSNLLTLLVTANSEFIPSKSLETVGSVTAMYAKGHLGFVPKVHREKRQPPMKMNMDSQVGLSFEELLKARSELELSSESTESVEEIEIQQEEVEESSSSSSSSSSKKASVSGEKDSDESLTKLTPPSSSVITTEVADESSLVGGESQDHDEIYGEYEEADAQHQAILQAIEGMEDTFVEGLDNDVPVDAGENADEEGERGR